MHSRYRGLYILRLGVKMLCIACRAVLIDKYV